VLADDPLLTARPSQDKKSIRIVLDSLLRIPPDCRLLETAENGPVIVVTSRRAVESKPQAAQELARKGAELLTYPDMQGHSNLHFLLEELGRRGISQLLVEGGPTVLASFLKENLADEIVVYIAPIVLGARGTAEIAGPMAQLAESVGLNRVDVARLGDDVRLSGLTDKALREIGVGPAKTEPPVESMVAEPVDE